MKKLNKLIFGILIILFGCNEEDFFKEANPPANDIIGEVTTTKDLENLINGAYFAFNGDGGGGMVDWVNVMSDLSSDIGRVHLDGQDVYTWDYIVIYNHENENDDFRQINNIWLAAYSTIEACNQAIFAVENNIINDDLAEQWQPRIKGEALFLRAFSYFSLAKIFAPPYGADNSKKSLILKVSPSESAFDLYELSSVEEVYQQILRDLNDAIQLLPETFIPGVHPDGYKVRAVEDAARFLLARVYFQMGSEYWDESLTQINAVLGENKYPLVNAPVDNWLTTGGQAGYTPATSEIVFRFVEFYQSYWRGPHIFRPFGINGRSITDVNTSRSFSLSNHFLNETGWNDPDEASKDLRYLQLFTRYENSLEDPLRNLNYSEPAVWGNKWLRVKGQSIPLFRSAELYLTKAFILLKEGDKIGAANSLDVVRSRAWNEDLADDFVSSDPNEINENTINVERMKELAFEGDRLHYLQAIRENIPSGDRQGQGISWDSNNLIWPIPLTEKERNPNIN